MKVTLRITTYTTKEFDIPDEIIEDMDCNDFDDFQEWVIDSFDADFFQPFFVEENEDVEYEVDDVDIFD